jgi:hypothetical protein
MKKLMLAIPAYLAVSIVTAANQQSSNEPKAKPGKSEAVCPMHDAHSRMNERGEQGMGFSQTATTFFTGVVFGEGQVESFVWCRGSGAGLGETGIVPLKRRRRNPIVLCLGGLRTR